MAPPASGDGGWPASLLQLGYLLTIARQAVLGGDMEDAGFLGWQDDGGRAEEAGKQIFGRTSRGIGCARRTSSTQPALEASLQSATRSLHIGHLTPLVMLLRHRDRAERPTERAKSTTSVTRRLIVRTVLYASRCTIVADARESNALCGLGAVDLPRSESSGTSGSIYIQDVIHATPSRRGCSLADHTVGLECRRPRLPGALSAITTAENDFRLPILSGLVNGYRQATHDQVTRPVISRWIRYRIDREASPTVAEHGKVTAMLVVFA
nr:hypothetical protein CFP56_19437 [Quercus suber]